MKFSYSRKIPQSFAEHDIISEKKNISRILDLATNKVLKFLFRKYFSKNP